MERLHKNRRGLDRVRRATTHSLAGLATAWRSEAAFRQEIALAVILLPASLWVGRGWVEVTLLMASVWLVLIVELLNSSVEAAVDRVSFELHDLSRNAKDVASAAVFLSLLLCGGIWATALWQRLGGAG